MVAARSLWRRQAVEMSPHDPKQPVANDRFG
jgi:hypothetical protein